MDQYAVMGNPIQHSWSPRIHQFFAKQTQQSLSYRPILVPLDAFSQSISDFKAQGGKGLNITLPFKQQAYQQVDQLSERAKIAQAVNTISFNPDGSSFGDNTDGIGFVRDVIDHHQFSLKNARILILGAGGAVRGILAPLIQESPASILIANRTKENAQLLATEFDLQVSAVAELAKYQFDLVINATSASLTGAELDLPQAILSDQAFCYDMVYGKGITPFMAWATHNRAAKVSDGLGMLIEQAAEAFFLWRKVRPNTPPILERLKNCSSDEFLIK